MVARGAGNEINRVAADPRQCKLRTNVRSDACHDIPRLDAFGLASDPLATNVLIRAWPLTVDRHVRSF